MSQNTSTTGRKLTWLITGCSSGFGLSLARIIQAHGHKLIATSRNPSATPDLVQEVEANGGNWIALDVADANTPDTISQLEKSGEHIDVLVNNAGFCKFAPIETATDEDIRQQFETMYLGPLRLIKAVIPLMRSRKFGLIINLSSGAAVDGNPTMGPYAGAKAALDATTKVLSKEVAAFNIKTITVIQGTSNTNFSKAPVWSDQPLPEAYKGSMAEMLLGAVKSGAVPANSDPDKAMKAVFDVAITDDATQHRIVPVGPDMVKRLEGLRQSTDESLDKFREVAMSAAVIN